MTDSEDLRASIDEVIQKNFGDTVLNQEAATEFEALFTQALQTERQRIVAALPTKRTKVLTADGPEIAKAYMDGFNVAIDQAKQAINNQQSKGA